jgi:hypothetical protein
MIDDLDDPVRFKALVAVKWQGEHLQIVCNAYFREEDGEAVFMIGRHLLPPGEDFSGGAHAIDYVCPPESMKRVSGEEYRYLGTILVDLDASQSLPLSSPTEESSPDSVSEQY